LIKKNIHIFMSDLTEKEIFDCLSENFRLAAENCLKIATSPKRGKIYRELIDQLSLIEGASRQACHWRGDTRWLDIADKAAYAQKFSGDWLRRYNSEKSIWFLKKLFVQLGLLMNFGFKLSLDLKDKKTGILGPILPENMKSSLIKGDRNICMRISNGGIIIPDGVMV